MKYFFLIILSFILLLACNSESKKKEIAANNSIKTELEISDLNRKLISKINSYYRIRILKQRRMGEQ